ncbi:MAG: hypothetical protein PVF08_08475 [Gammaproteobacteria bacterium]|jgi:hypothetical protein
MKRLYLALLMMLFSMATLAAGEGATQAASDQQDTSPWLPLPEGEPVLTMRDVPLDLMYGNPEKYLGTVFEDRFKFFHIYRDKEDMDPARSRQTIVGETHFTARPVQQSVHVVRIRITPEQDAWILDQGIRRQDVVKARVRFAGLAPSGALAFDLLEIEESVRSWRLRRTGD